MRRFDLRQKKVIDVDTAEVIGYIRDMDIDFETGKIKSLTIPKAVRRGFCVKRRSISVSWKSVIAIGSEFVTVKTEREQ